MLSNRIRQLKPSPTLTLDAKVKELKQQGIEILNLSIGEPDFDTPENIKKAAIQAIKDGFTHYTRTEGFPKLRQAISLKFKLDNNLLYEPSEIIVGAGSKTLLYEIFQVLCDKEDEVLIPVPAWPTYIEQIKLSLANPVFIKLDPPFKLTAADI